VTTKRPLAWVLYPIEPQQTSGSLSGAITSLRREFHVFEMDGDCLGIEDPGGRLTQDRVDKILPFVWEIVKALRKEST
jgi:hypothetical protein